MRCFRRTGRALTYFRKAGKWACCLILLTLTLPAQTQPSQYTQHLTGILTTHGYENVRVSQQNDTTFIGLENRVWRWESWAAAEVFNLAIPLADSTGVISLTLLRWGIPVTTVVVARKQFDALRAGRISNDIFTDSVRSVLSSQGYKSAVSHLRPANRSFNKFDVVIVPQLKFQFGNFDQPLEAQFNIAPAVHINFLKGMTFTGQVIFPIYNNLLNDPEGNTIRPGLVVLGQSFRLPYNIFATASAGYFTRNRYGFNGEVRKFLFNGKMGVGATLGYTGQVQLLEGLFTYTPLNVVTWFCDASWRFARYDLTVRAGYGGFINNDRGWRVDVSRQFGEVSVGFFAMRTDGMVNGGFNFIVPLPPRKLGTKNHIRLRPAPYVPWEYRAKGLPSYGRTFSTGNETGDWLFHMNPDDIRKQLGKQIIK